METQLGPVPPRWPDIPRYVRRTEVSAESDTDEPSPLRDAMRESVFDRAGRVPPLMPAGPRQDPFLD